MSLSKTIDGVFTAVVQRAAQFFGLDAQLPQARIWGEFTGTSHDELLSQ
jgi:hypothetical protein